MRKNLFAILFLLGAGLMITGCDLVPLHMRDQPKYEPLEPSTFFDDGMASRPLPPDTVPRGEWGLIKMNEGFYTGQVNGEFVEEIPIPVTREVLERGQERFNIFCSPCHSRVGDGQGMIVQRGFPQPPSYHIERLRQQPDGYFYDVITNGFGVMYSYDARIPPADRWAIVAYIRALQLSQNAPLDAVPEDQRQELEEIQ
jgi:hypothetical protein